MREVVEAVAELRGLPSPRVAIAVEEPEAYAAEVSAWRRRIERVRTLSPPDVARPLADYDRTLSRSLGYFDPERNAIVLLHGPGTSLFDLESTLAHEAQHALQHAHFPPARNFEAQDRQLAYEALEEGDAELTQALFVAARTGVTSSRVVLELSDPDRVADLLDAGPDEVGSVFPYVAGTRFVAELYRMGGFAAVDRAFEHPPESTEQILHPQRYLDDDPPATIPPFQGLAEHVVVDEGRRGELGSRSWLRRCAPLDEDTEDPCLDCVEGWGGDRFAILDGPAEDLHLWSTVWDDGASAARFAARVGTCEGEVRRLGRRVLFAAGGTAAARAQALRSMASVHSPWRPCLARLRSGRVGCT